MAVYSYIPGSVFGIPLRFSEDPLSSRLPRMYSKGFSLLRATIENNLCTQFEVAASLSRPDVGQAIALAELVNKETGLPCVICSPELAFWQKKKLARANVPFIQNESNMFLPFLGTVISESSKHDAPELLSPQAQRVFSNLLSGQWAGLRASDLAERVEKSKASVSNYLAEIARVSPSLIKKDGREKTLCDPGFGKEDMLERFEPYLSSPVAKTTKIASIPLKCAADKGFLLAGMSALEAKTDLSFNESSIVLATQKGELKSAIASNPDVFREVPWYEDGFVVQEWAYPIDQPDTACLPECGIAAIDDLGLYLSLKDEKVEDIRVQDALEQVRSKICR